ncbi:interferon-induced protein 44-like [Saccostrea echinata]|uniref:interferon-induced protein 44-like n=1 Tax=Saccostrea echinata TaxID=191078 RepID=UPI002A7F57F6|nr:interferon-induced protein 44-like [Saccostrea echinata]
MGILLSKDTRTTEGTTPNVAAKQDGGPPPLMERPWRDFNWRDKDELLYEVSNYQIKGGVKYLNCMLLGQAASGKTSFFNTCASALKNKDTVLAPLTVYKPSEKSVTSTFETHALYTKDEKTLPVRIFDCRGLHNVAGVLPEDVRQMVEGHIKSGYQINPGASIQSNHAKYRLDAQLGDKMHCLVYVVNADNPKAALADESAVEIFANMRKLLAPLNLPQLVLMNKVDRLRASLSDDISLLFKSNEVYNKLKVIADFMVLPEMNVLPMSNYHMETVPDPKKDVLALSNLKMIMDRANDFLQRQDKTNIPEDFLN